MKQILLTLILLISASCGREVIEHYPDVIEVPIEREIIKQVEIDQLYEGRFAMPHGGYIELVQDADGEVSTIGSADLLSTNPQNDTIGEHPHFGFSNLKLLGGAIKFTRDFNYTTGGDLEEDVSGSNIHDRRRTDIELKMLDNGTLRVTVKIWDAATNSNINFIVAERTLESQ